MKSTKPSNIKIFVVILFFLITSIPVLGAEKTFRAGAATSDITSPLGSKIIGGFVPFPSPRGDDKLHSPCLGAGDGTTKISIGVFDLFGLTQHVSGEARGL